MRVLVIFGLVFTGVGIGVFYLLIKPSLDAKDILKNGIETKATLMDIGSNMSKGSESYYWLKLSFVNSDGETITCKTDSLYPVSFIKGRGIAEYNQDAKKYEVTKEPVRVMYMGDKAVLKDFVPKDDEDWATWMIPGVFGGVGVLILLSLILGPVVGRFPVIQQLLGLILLVGVGFVFAGIGGGTYLWILKPPMEAAKILKNGTETTATVIEADSKLAVNNKPYYYLVLSYANSEGEEITCKTNSLYDKYFLWKMEIATEINHTTGKYDEQQVQVMYIGDRAVVKGFVPEKGDMWLWVFPVVFGAIGVGIWLALVWGIVISAGGFFIKYIGVAGTGIYLKHEQNTISGVTTCNIYYTFENKHRKKIEAKTGFVYRDFEAEGLAAMRRFPVRYIGKKSVVMVDRNDLKIYGKHHRNK